MPSVPCLASLDPRRVKHQAGQDSPAQVLPRSLCENFLYGFKAAPRGRSRRRHSAHASAPAGAPATAAPTPVGWREGQETFGAAVDRQRLPEVRPRGVHAPAAELSKAGQNPSRPSVTAGQPQPLSCLAEVHAKTTLTEPARPRRWQRSEAWTRVARTVDAQRQGSVDVRQMSSALTKATFTDQAADRASQLHRGQR